MATKIRPFNLHTDTETRIQTLAGNLIDSAYVNARVSTVDSAAVQVIIDSDYVKTTLKVGSTNTIFRYVSTANQTSFTGSDANSATLAYNPGAVQVFLNGSLLTPTVDFTTDSGDTITLVSGAALGSELVINTYKDGIITPTNALPIIGGELTGNLTMGDNKKIKLGNDSDAEIFHNASNTIINDKGTGDILLQVAGTTHFQTNATGVQVPDNKKLQLGTSNDLEIIHDGSNSIINDAGTGDLKLQIGGSDKVAVTSAGASITGTLGVTGSLTVDDITINGSTISDAGDLTIDVAGNITLDADGGQVNFDDGGTNVGKLIVSSNGGDFIMSSRVSDKDIVFSGNDGGSMTEVLRLDMSDAGAAYFNSNIYFAEYLTHAGDTDTYLQYTTNQIDLFAGNKRGITLTANEVIINQNGVDLDFNVETNNDTSTLFVQGSSDRVGIGTANPSSKFVIYDATYPYIYLQNSTTGQGTNDGFSMVEYGTDIYINNRENGNMLFYNNGSERMRIDASGNVGIGTTDVRGKLQIGSGNGGGNTPSGHELLFGTNNSDITFLSANDNASVDGTIGAWNTVYNHQNSKIVFNKASANTGQLQFFTNSGSGITERIRIFSGGNTTFSTTNQSPAEGTAVGARIGITGKVQLSAASAACLQANRSDNNGGVIVFRRGGTVCGEIAVNGDSQTTAYQTSSDYRLKENVSYDFDATARLKQLKPARFNWISDKNKITVDGFLAHEVSSIVPEAIGGEKDGTQELDDVVLNSDGTVNSSEITEKDWVAGKEDKTYADDTTWVASKTVPKYQGIDQAKLVPLLVKTIQELEARITELENK